MCRGCRGGRGGEQHIRGRPLGDVLGPGDASRPERGRGGLEPTSNSPVPYKHKPWTPHLTRNDTSPPFSSPFPHHDAPSRRSRHEPGPAVLYRRYERDVEREVIVRVHRHDVNVAHHVRHQLRAVELNPRVGGGGEKFEGKDELGLQSPNPNNVKSNS